MQIYNQGQFCFVRSHQQESFQQHSLWSLFCAWWWFFFFSIYIFNCQCIYFFLVLSLNSEDWTQLCEMEENIKSLPLPLLFFFWFDQVPKTCVKWKKNWKLGFMSPKRKCRRTCKPLVGRKTPSPQATITIHTSCDACVFMSAHTVCVSAGREMQSVLNYWAEFSRAEGQWAKGGKKDLMKNRCRYVVYQCQVLKHQKVQTQFFPKSWLAKSSPLTV